jgi:hypothetical protein
VGGQLTLEEEHWASQRRGSSPKWHGDTWLFAWKLVLNFRMLGLRIDHVGIVDYNIPHQSADVV